MTAASAPAFFDSATAIAGPRALHDLLRRAILREVLSCLGKRGIPVMPLKGALLAYWVYDDPADRRVSDIDLLVPEGEYEEAIRALAARGYDPKPPVQSRERTLQAPGIPFPIDLHRSLFPKGRFRLSTKELFERGHEDSFLYGTPVVLPDPYDLYAHLVGHAACSHEIPIDPRTPRDLELLSRRFSMDARTCAARLESSGLGRAARYVLGACGGQPAFARRVLAGLRSDPWGDLLARFERKLGTHFPPESIVSRLGAHLTNPSLGLAAQAIFEALAERIRYLACSGKRPSPS